MQGKERKAVNGLLVEKRKKELVKEKRGSGGGLYWN